MATSSNRTIAKVYPEKSLGLSVCMFYGKKVVKKVRKLLNLVLNSRDGSRFSNILFNYRISDLSLTRSGHCRWSLNCIICMRF